MRLRGEGQGVSDGCGGGLAYLGYLVFVAYWYKHLILSVSCLSPAPD